MNKIIKKVIVFVFVAILVFSVGRINISAATATANISISSQTVALGGTVNISLRVSSSVNIAIMEFYLTYDSSILEYKSGAIGGGSGELRFYSDDTTKDVTYNLVFKALSPGTSAITYKTPQPAGCGVMPEDIVYGDEMVISGGTGSVSVAAPSNASSNANLGTLKVSAETDTGDTKAISLSPVFSADTTKYNLTLDDDIAKLVVSATAKDAKAITTISGTNISPGNNVTIISVTAENGTTKKYYIYSSQGDGAIVGSDVGLTVQIGDKTMEIASKLDGLTLPVGFEKTVIEYNATNIEVAINSAKGLTLFYLNGPVGEPGEFYLYYESDSLFYKYQTITVGSLNYILMKADDSVAIPDDYTRTTLTINGQSVDGWINDFEQEFGLIYAMNDSGEANLYMYDFKEGTIQRLNESLYMGLTSQEIIQLSESEAQAKAVKTRLIWVVIGLLVSLIALAVLYIIMLVERQKNKPEDLDYEEEIFVIQNEKPEEQLIEEKAPEKAPEKVSEEETTSFEDMKSRIFVGFDNDDDDIEVFDLDED